jgi:hypothetical protein
MRVAHTACIDGVQPGDVGAWDAAHPPVALWLRAGLLVPIAAPPVAPVDPTPAPVTPTPAQPSRARRRG